MLHAVGLGRRQRSLLDHFSTPARGTEVARGVRRSGHTSGDHQEKSERGGEVMGLRVQYNFGKGINVQRTAASHPQPEASVLSSEQAPRQRPRPRAPPRARRPGGRRTARGLRLAPSLTVGAGMLPREELMLAASFRLSESVNSTFLISESLEKRHSAAAGCTAWATRAACGKTPRTAGKYRGVEESGEEAGTREREGQRAETQLEERAEDGPVFGAVWQLGAGRCSVSAPGLPAAPREKEARGLETRRAVPSPPSPH